jgi:hypothetical protein
MIKISPPPVKEYLLIILEDFTKFDIKIFLKERYHLHFLICAIACLYSDYPLLIAMFVTVFFVFREVYYYNKSNKKTPFSWGDIRWTYYGGVFVYVLKLINSLTFKL